MAIVLRGFSEPRRSALARAMVDQRQDARPVASCGVPVLDKHSSGGVGDKVTLVLAPLVAACGGSLRQDVGPRARPHRWHARQARVDPGLSRAALAGRFPAPARAHRRGRREPERARRARRPHPLRAARRHGDGRERGPHRRQHHGQEGGQRHVGAGARSQGRQRRLHEDARRGELAGAPVPRRRRRRSVARSAACSPPWRNRSVLAVGNRLEVEEAWRVLSGEGPADVREVVLAVCARAPGARRPRHRRGTRRRRRAEAALADGRAAEQFERWCFVQGGRWKPGEFHRLAAVEVKAEQPAGSRASTRSPWAARRSSPVPAGRRSTTPSIRRRACVLARRAATRSPPATCWRRSTRATRAAARGREVLAEAFTVGDEPPAPRAVVLGGEEASVA